MYSRTRAHLAISCRGLSWRLNPRRLGFVAGLLSCMLGDFGRGHGGPRLTADRAPLSVPRGRVPGACTYERADFANPAGPTFHLRFQGGVLLPLTKEVTTRPSTSLRQEVCLAVADSMTVLRRPYLAAARVNVPWDFDTAHRWTAQAVDLLPDASPQLRVRKGPLHAAVRVAGQAVHQSRVIRDQGQWGLRMLKDPQRGLEFGATTVRRPCDHSEALNSWPLVGAVLVDAEPCGSQWRPTART